MKKPRKKPASLREKTFALSGCICTCTCTCACQDSCDCPIAPTHQIGLNAMSDINPSSTVSSSRGNSAREPARASAAQ